MARVDTSALPVDAEKRTTVTAMFDRIAPSYDRLNRVISLGQDRRWRRRTVAALALPPGARVLDLACGTGDLCRELAAAGLRPIGFDLSAGMLAHARAVAPFAQADALCLPVLDSATDGITCGFALRNFTDLREFMTECVRALRPGGRAAFLDAAQPTGTLARWGHAAWFRHAVPRIGGLLGDRAAYRYLPASTAYLPSGDELVAMLTAAGFTDVTRHTMTAGAVQLLTGTKP